MTQQRWSLEIKVGAWVVLGLALLIFFIFAIGDFSTLFQPGYDLRVMFDSANGIMEGAPVQYAGVEVGKVQSIRLVYPKEGTVPKVELIARLPTTVKVRADDQAAISTFGLLGEKYLEILQGEGAGNILGPNGQLIGKPPISTERIMERSSDVLDEFKQTLSGINKFVADPESGVYFKEAMIEARDAARHWKTIGERFNLTLSQMEAGQGSLGKIVYTDALYNQMSDTIADLRAHPWKLLQKPPKEEKKKR